MKVLWFVNTPFYGDQLDEHQSGGRGGWLLNLAGLIRDEFDLSTAFVEPYGPRERCAGRINAFAIRPKHWPLRLFLKSFFNYTDIEDVSVNQLYEIIRKVDPDIIHIHGTEKGFIRLLDPKLDIGVPIITSFQGVMGSLCDISAPVYDKGFLNRFWVKGSGESKLIPPKRLNRATITEYKQASREREFTAYAKYVDGRTRFDRNAAGLLAPNARYFHIDRVLRPAFYDADWDSSALQQCIAISTMSDSLRKGFDVVAKATAHISRRVPSFRWQVAGLTSDSMAVRAARKIMGDGYPSDAIELLGKLGPDDLASAISSASVYVQPSYAENSPNSLAEGQLVGAPCIATFAGGTVSYIEHNVNGVLVPTGDALSMAGAIVALLGDPVAAEHMAMRGKQDAHERHRPERIKRDLGALYESVLG